MRRGLRQQRGSGKKRGTTSLDFPLTQIGLSFFIVNSVSFLLWGTSNFSEYVFGVEKGRRTMQHGMEDEKNEHKKNTSFLNPVETGDF